MEFRLYDMSPRQAVMIKPHQDGNAVELWAEIPGPSQRFRLGVFLDGCLHLDRFCKMDADRLKAAGLKIESIGRAAGKEQWQMIVRMRHDFRER